MKKKYFGPSMDISYENALDVLNISTFNAFDEFVAEDEIIG